MDITNKEILYSRPLLSVQDIINYIDKGEKYISNNVNDDPISAVEYLGAIILNPTYQREYRSTIKEESLIIESILCNIPIPEVFLVQVPNNLCQIRNVMDGRHRLNAIYRFVKGKYKLQGFSLVKNIDDYNGKSFNEIPNDAKIRILTYKISVLEFSPLSDDDIERELFTRYNKATKPLEAQEIRYATYISNTSQYVSRFIKQLQPNSALYKAYNITDSRSKTQKVHQNIFVILSIIEYGLNPQYYKSTEIADNYMRIKSVEYRENKENVENTRNIFQKFNEFVTIIATNIKYPFSIRLFEYKTGAGNYLFRTGVSMFVAALFYYFYLNFKEPNFFNEFNLLLNTISNSIGTDDICNSNSKIMSKGFLKLFEEHKFETNNIKFNDSLFIELKNKLNANT
ncbi:DUF262 domain-containing protein [Ruminococcus sp.]|uniref:DUF262 domain-containing protein n=1 Tax=Ruminococcus sp. TaxID=41978 RepID=UPI0025FCEE9C|nr:DUF262 domain-containing protein [Ruminococcus sp.]MBR1432572.1 DUF262 domain-containing protein [Ruminococcus sp.]